VLEKSGKKTLNLLARYDFIRTYAETVGLLGLRNETKKLRFVTFAIATISFAKYNQLIRVDTDKEQKHG
jgi:hypothetical protein